MVDRHSPPGGLRLSSLNFQLRISDKVEAAGTPLNPIRQAAQCRFYFSKLRRRAVHQMVITCLRRSSLILA